MRIAYFSPFPPERSGIADYSAELLPYLARLADLTLYAAEPEKVDREFSRQFDLRPLDRYHTEQWRYDLALYHMGNSEYHEALYPIMLHYPGVVVLHDLFIHHFIAHMTTGKDNFAAYARELGYVLGQEGIYLAQETRLGKFPVPLYELPLNERILDVSLGVIAHSQFVADKIRARGVGTPVRVIPHFARYQGGNTRRRELDLGEDAVIFASFGLITQDKQVGHILEAFDRLRTHVPDAHYLFVGGSVGDIDLDAIIEANGLGYAVHHVDYVSDTAVFIDWIHTADVVVNLRYPTVGETSGAALRALAVGKPVIVYDHGWYAELPDAAVIKVPPLEQDALLDALLKLADSPQLRIEVGRAARQYTDECCHPSAVAASYITALSDTLEYCLKRYA